MTVFTGRGTGGADAPRIAITCDVTGVGSSPQHCVKEKYIEAVAGGCKAIPVLLPALTDGGEMGSVLDRFDLNQIMDGIDGLFLTGNSSNIEPVHYSGAATPDVPQKLDRQRDHSNLRLVRWALSLQLPIFGLCRGLQEINVALGGTLVANINNNDKGVVHMPPSGLSRSEQYRPAHELRLTPGGKLAKLLNLETIKVNSLHEQGIGEIADDLFVEGISPDGIVEAVSHKDPKQRLLAVQWHPEWAFLSDSVSTKIFGHFGQMVHEHRQKYLLTTQNI